VPCHCQSHLHASILFLSKLSPPLFFKFCLSRSFWYLQRHDVPFSSLILKFGNFPAALTDDLLFEAQSVYFFTLIVMQWGCVNFYCGVARNSTHYHVCFVAYSNLLSTRTRRSSIFQQPPTWSVNCAVIPAALIALIAGIFISYVHALYVLSNLCSRLGELTYDLLCCLSLVIPPSRRAGFPRNISSSRWHSPWLWFCTF
jgi:hypothetical protein